MGSSTGPTRLRLPEVQGFEARVFEREYRATSRPVVLRGAAARWPATRTWSPAMFVERFGDVEITPSVNLPDTEVPYTARDVDHRQRMTVRDLVARMDAGDRCYIDQVVSGHYPGLDRDYDFESLGPSPILTVLVWIGSRTRSGLHYDYVDNFFAQVHGTKHAILAAPEDAPYLHVFSDAHTKSQVGPIAPDLEKHPRFRQATLLEARLEPGDVLYLPRGWWHYFASSERSISLSCWHGVPLGPTHDLEVMMSLREPGPWLRLARDFVWHGVLGRPYTQRLYSPPPTGVMVYELLASRLRQASR